MTYSIERDILTKIGLSKNESDVFLSLLRLGPSMVGKIAKESLLDRSSVYDALNKLEEKGLVSFIIEQKRKIFTSAHPSKLMDYLKEKEDIVKEISPKLIDMYSRTKLKSNINLYRGYKGLKSVFLDILREAKENLVIDSSGQFVEKMPLFSKYFIRETKERKIKIRHLVRKGIDIHPSKTTELRFLPRKLQKNIVTTNIYAYKVAIVIWSETPEAVIIENKFVAEAYKDYFELLWSLSKK